MPGAKPNWGGPADGDVKKLDTDFLPHHSKGHHTDVLALVQRSAPKGPFLAHPNSESELASGPICLRHECSNALEAEFGHEAAEEVVSDHLAALERPIPKDHMNLRHVLRDDIGCAEHPHGFEFAPSVHFHEDVVSVGEDGRERFAVTSVVIIPRLWKRANLPPQPVNLVPR